jgi:hypothetical protein
MALTAALAALLGGLGLFLLGMGLMTEGLKLACRWHAAERPARRDALAGAHFDGRRRPHRDRAILQRRDEHGPESSAVLMFGSGARHRDACPEAQ